MSAIFQVYGLTRSDGAVGFAALSALTADALPADAAAHGRMHIMGAGEWKGHPSGPLSIDREYLANLVAQFDAQKNPMPVDYDHSLPKRGDSRAAGWIHAMAIEDDAEGVPQLWATDVEWTPAAAKAIRDKEYQFSSPFWFHDSKDRVTGEPTGPRMANVAITNNPFFDGQQPLMCSDFTAAETATNEAKPMDEILAAIAKSAGITPEAVLERLAAKADEIGAMLRDAPPPAKGDDVAPPAPVAASQVSAEEAAKIASEGRLNGLIASVESLTKKIDARDKADADAKAAADAKAETERTDRIKSMVRDGRLLAAEETDAAKLLAYDAASGTTLFDTTYGSRKPTVPLKVVQAGNEPRTVTAGENFADGLTASELVAFKNLTHANWKPETAREQIIARRPATN